MLRVIVRVLSADGSADNCPMFLKENPAMSIGAWLPAVLVNMIEVVVAVCIYTSGEGWLVPEFLQS